MILLLAGCDTRGPAELYRDALHASTWEEGRDTCGKLPEADRGDCLVAVMEVHQRLDRADCETIPAGLWHSECVFLFAEREAKAGNLAYAVEACDRSGFGRECSYHLIREGARAVLDASIEDAAKATATWDGMQHAPDAERLFWRTWFRERLQKKIPVDPSGCTTPACNDGARETILMTLNGLARARGEAFCDGSLPSPVQGDRTMWVETGAVHEWIFEFVEGECARRSGRARGGAPHPSPGGPPR